MEYVSKDKPVVLKSGWAGSHGTIDTRQQSMRCKTDNLTWQVGQGQHRVGISATSKTLE